MGDAATPTIPNFTNQTASVYKANIDAGFAVADRLAWAFAPHQQDQGSPAPDMTLRLEAGAIFDGATLTEVAAQSTGTIIAPSVDPRIDRVVIDRATGAVSVIAGSEAASPTPPAITSGKVPIAQVLLATSTIEISNSDITDERDLGMLGVHGIAGAGLEVDTNQNIRVNAPHERKTANYTAVTTDRARLIEMDKTTAVTLNLTAAATLGEGWFVYVHNSGAGVLTIDPNSTENIDDETTINLDQDQSAIVFCDGTSFWTVGRMLSSGGLQSVQVFTSSGTWNRPTGITAVQAIVVGGGGGGGYGEAGGGGAGGVGIELIDVSSVSSATVTRGAGGSGDTGPAGTGGTGGTSSFGAFVSATGGAGGNSDGGSPARIGGFGGVGSGGDININGGPGENGDNGSNYGGSGGTNAYGGGGRGSLSSVGTAGRSYGGGGGGGGSLLAGAAGAAGVVIVWEYK